MTSSVAGFRVLNVRPDAHGTRWPSISSNWVSRPELGPCCHGNNHMQRHHISSAACSPRSKGNGHRRNSLVNSPMPSIATVTLLIGSFIDPTPSDVPQQIRSPGNNVMSCEILLTSCCALKIMSEIGYDWRSSPLRIVRTTSLAGSIPDAMTGPNGQKPSYPLARAHCANVVSLLITSAAVISLTQV